MSQLHLVRVMRERIARLGNKAALRVQQDGQWRAIGWRTLGQAMDYCAQALIRAGHHARGGKLPINTHGGQLGEAYIHGMNGVAEAVRQVRGNAVNQVANVENVLVTAGTGVPTSGLILGAA